MPLTANSARTVVDKVPQVALAFWLINICATTLGETGGDALSTTLKLGYAASTAIFIGVFLVMLFAQVSAKRYNPVLYWLAILSTTTAGATMSDFLDRTAHLGDIGGSLALACVLVTVLIGWRLTMGSISFERIVDRKVETFYWITILFSNTLGTALGDLISDDAGLGYLGGAAAMGGALALIAGACVFTKTSRTLLFWLAFVIARPLGATLGDALTKTHAQGGLDLGTLPPTALLAVAMIVLVFLTARKPAPVAAP